MKNFLIDRHSPLSLYYSVYCFFWHGDDYDDACGLKATAFFVLATTPPNCVGQSSAFTPDSSQPKIIVRWIMKWINREK